MSASSARRGTATGVIAGALILLPIASAGAVAPAAKGAEATVSVLHAIPIGLGADVVDVYAGKTLLIDDLTPGALKTVKVSGGSYDLAVFADGTSPSSGTALLSVTDARIPARKNITVAAHLTAAGRPALTSFVNDTSTVGRGMGRLTVRNIAAVGPLDVRSGGSVLLAGIRNPRQGDIGLNARGYRITMVQAGTKRAVMPTSNVYISNTEGTQDMGTNTIVYVWGSAADGTLRQAVQNVRIDLR